MSERAVGDIGDPVMGAVGIEEQVIIVIQHAIASIFGPEGVFNAGRPDGEAPGFSGSIPPPYP